MVERNLAKVEVESSRLFSRSRFLRKGKRRLPFFTKKGFGRGSKAVMPRIANPVSAVRLRAAPPDFLQAAFTVCGDQRKVDVEFRACRYAAFLMSSGE